LINVPKNEEEQDESECEVPENFSKGKGLESKLFILLKLTVSFE
jgi:hypothetical protein